jgi:hypothetical protein
MKLVLPHGVYAEIVDGAWAGPYKQLVTTLNQLYPIEPTPAAPIGSIEIRQAAREMGGTVEWDPPDPNEEPEPPGRIY